MKKEFGASAGVLALLAMVVHTQFPAASEQVVSKPMEVEATKARVAPRLEADEPMEGPWLATRECFNTTGSGSPCPSVGSGVEWGLLVPIALVTLSAILLGPSSIGGFENPWHNRALGAMAVVLLVALAAACGDIWFTWARLARLLDLADAPPLNEAFSRVADGWVKRPLWSRGPLVSNRHVFLQMGRALEGIAGEAEEIRRFCQHTADTGTQNGESWDSYFTRLRTREQTCAELAAKLIVGRGSSPSDRAARADFVALQLTRYFSYALRQVKSMAWCVSFEILILTLLLNSYSPQAPLLIGRYLAVLLAGVGVVITTVYAEMERNAVLSAMTRTTAGQLGGDFWIQLIALGVLPLIGVLAHLFPEISGFLWSWAAPGLQAAH